MSDDNALGDGVNRMLGHTLELDTEVEQLRAELTAAKAEVERVSKLYLEMRDGHEHVVHIMHADLDRHKRALEKCKEQRNVNIHGIDTREIDYIAGQYDEEITRILEGGE